MPIKTPVWVPSSFSVDWPAFSSASQLVSSSRRCCGSMLMASRGEIPKNAASNWSIFFNKRAVARGHFSRDGNILIVESSRLHLSGGTSVIASTPSCSNLPKAVGIVGIAWKAQAHADDRDWFVLGSSNWSSRARRLRISINARLIGDSSGVEESEVMQAPFLCALVSPTRPGALLRLHRRKGLGFRLRSSGFILS